MLSTRPLPTTDLKEISLSFGTKVVVLFGFRHHSAQLNTGQTTRTANMKTATNEEGEATNEEGVLISCRGEKPAHDLGGVAAVGGSTADEQAHFCPSQSLLHGGVTAVMAP